MTLRQHVLRPLAAVVLLPAVLSLAHAAHAEDSPRTVQVVVFPFASLDDEAEAISIDLTQMIIASLRQVPELEIVAPGDLPDGLQSPDDHQLWPEDGPVDLAVEGVVQQQDSGVRIGVQLIGVGAKSHMSSSVFLVTDGDFGNVVDAVKVLVGTAAENCE